MRVLVTWGSKRGGTAGLAAMVGDALRDRGVDVAVLSTERVERLDGFDAVIVGGALYANRWHRAARRFVTGHVAELRRIPVWFFSSGPLDDSAPKAPIPPTREVATLMERVGALGHATFGGRLAPDARGFPASAMARKRGGDWRDAGHVGSWAAQIAQALPSARPGPATDSPARSPLRLFAHALAGWAACAAIMFGLLAVTGTGTAIAVHDLAVPVVFALLARHYFRARGGRDPLPAALGFTLVVALLDLGVVAAALQRSLALARSLTGFWLPLLLVFLVTWATGVVMAMRPVAATPEATGPRS